MSRIHAARVLHWALLASFATCAPLTAAAQDYVVEVLVFERVTPGYDTSNVWPADPGVLAIDGEIYDVGTAGVSPLDPARFGLANIASDLQTSGLYRTVYHGAWLQPRFRDESAPRVRFSGGAGGVDVEGLLRTYAVRDAHIDFDMLYRGGIADSIATGGLRLRARRRMKFNQVHYLDHPLIGAFVQVRR